jgi:hypothetical protein
MTNTLELTILNSDGGSRQIEFSPSRMFNGGLAGSNPKEVEKHIEELAEIGIPPSKFIPTLYAVGAHLLTTDQHIQVHGDKTGGEVEYVLLWHEDDIYVTVGSDHTDLWLERHSSPKAKNVCQNIIPPVVWRYEDVRDHFDALELESFVRIDGEWRDYQRDKVISLLQPSYWIDRLLDRVDGSQGLVFFSGTIPALGSLLHGDAYRVRLQDPILDRRIEHEYVCDIISGLEDF